MKFHKLIKCFKLMKLIFFKKGSRLCVCFVFKVYGCYSDSSLRNRHKFTVVITFKPISNFLLICTSCMEAFKNVLRCMRRPKPV